MEPVIMALFNKYGEQVDFIVVDTMTRNGNSLANQREVTGLPTMEFINSRGEVVETHVGWISAGDLEAKIQALIRQ
ncbi:MAG: thioredoxin family protein [Bacillota bacterium]